MCVHRVRSCSVTGLLVRSGALDATGEEGSLLLHFRGHQVIQNVVIWYLFLD
jgi:hypothetical protein